MRSACERLRRFDRGSSMRATIRPPHRASQSLRRSTFETDADRKPIRNSRAGCVRLARMDETAVLDRLAALEIETPVVGLRQLRHALPRLPVAGRRARRSGSGSPTPRSCTGSPAAARRSRCTSPGTASTTGPRSRAYAEEQGIRIGAINPNLFGEDEYRLGSLCHPDAAVRAQRARPLPRVHRDRAGRSARRRSASGSPTARTTRARTTSRARHARLVDGLEQLYAAAAAGDAAARRVQVLRAGLLQHRPARLGHRRARCAGASGRRRRCSSTPATTRRGRTSSRSWRVLLAEGLLGGFHFNNRKYADDDLIVGAIDPFELFRIMREIACARRRAGERRAA